MRNTLILCLMLLMFASGCSSKVQTQFIRFQMARANNFCLHLTDDADWREHCENLYQTILNAQ